MKTNYINQLQRDIMRDCDHTDSTQEQSILSMEDRARKYVESDNKKNQLYGQFYQTYLAGANEMLPIIKELGEALNIAKKAVPQFEYGQGERFETDVYAKIQTTLDKYKNYL